MHLPFSVFVSDFITNKISVRQCFRIPSLFFPPQVSSAKGQLVNSVQVTGPGQLFIVSTRAGSSSPGTMFSPFGSTDKLAYALASSAVTAESCWAAVELGAEVVCSQGDATPLKRSLIETGLRLSPTAAAAGASVPMVSALSRRCSYEEVVHSEIMDQDLKQSISFQEQVCQNRSGSRLMRSLLLLSFGVWGH
jgi:hypothetical protein